MRTSPRPNLLWCWIALVAVLFTALAPAISQAVAPPASAQQLLEICTAQGIAYVQPSGDQDQPHDSTLSRHLNHCAFCATHATPAALPPSDALVVAVLRGHDAYPPLFYLAPRRLTAWIAASPRGPPSTA